MITADGTLVVYGEGAREAARRMLRGLPDSCFVPLSEALGEAGTKAFGVMIKDGPAQVVLVAGLDEQARFLGGAGGVAGVLDSIVLDMDGGRALAAEVAGAPREAHGLWEAAGKLGPFGRELCRRTAGELERLAAEAAGTSTSPIAAQVVLVDPAGERMIGMFGRMVR